MKANVNLGGALQAVHRLPKLIAPLATLKASDSAQLSRRYVLGWMDSPRHPHDRGCPSDAMPMFPIAAQRAASRELGGGVERGNAH